MYLFNLIGDLLHKFNGSDDQTYDQFGKAVATYGKLVVVGAGQASENGVRTVAYIFNLDTKDEMLRLTPADGAADDSFDLLGVAIYENIIMVNAYKHGNGTVYTFDATTGQQLRKFVNTDVPQNWWFGRSSALAFHASTNVGIVGNHRENRGGALGNAGAVYVFDLNTGTQIRKIIPAISTVNMYFGSSLFVSEDFLLVGAPGADSFSGRVYVFDSNANWVEITYFGPSDSEIGGRFGFDMASSASHFIIGAFFHDDGPSDGARNGAVYIGKTAAGANCSKFIPTHGV